MRFIIIILSFTLFACNSEEEYLKNIKLKAETFIKTNSNNFLSNNRLLRYNYNPRGKFTLHSDSSNSYRARAKANELKIICFSKNCNLNEDFLQSPVKLKKGKYIFKSDSIVKETHNSHIKQKFKSDPKLYFQNLEKNLKEYSIFSFHQGKDKSFIKLYLDINFYLIFTPKKDYKPHIGKDKVITVYNKNWVLVKMDRPMDLG
tara:strand:+ start:59 stop:667 length:609 start_codon:yes stop_codon:yes gene_type:complete